MCSSTGMASSAGLGWAVVKTVSQLPVQRIAVPASITQSSSPAAVVVVPGRYRAELA